MLLNSGKSIHLNLENEECFFTSITAILSLYLMEPIPLPSHVHYELLLQLLERKALSASSDEPAVREKVQQLIITLRKALAQQKQIEAICEQTHLPYEHRWSINSKNALENNKL